jgi:hypothetical protein
MAAALELPLREYHLALAQTHAARSESLHDFYSDHSQ